MSTHHLRAASPEFGSTPSDLLVMCEDAIREWEHAADAASRDGATSHREAALVNTFQALASAVRLAGVPDEVASSVFRRLVGSSGVLR